MKKEKVLSKANEKNWKFIESYRNASNAATGSQFDSNANVTSKNISTLQTELGKEGLLSSNYFVKYHYLNKLYGEEIADQYLSDEDDHIIYPHDSTSLQPYCVAASMYPFLLNGLKDLGGSSEAPKHTDSYIGGTINLVFLLASQFAGAVAIPEFLTYMDHFLRIDYGQDYIDNLDRVVETFSIRQQTLKGKITDWFQQFVYSVNQPAGARNYQSPFTNISYFDKYYFESIFKDFVFPDGDEPCWETTKELQKMFMKWFNAERLNTILTFPVESANLLVDKKTGKYKDEETADFMAEMWSEGHSFFMYQSDSADSLSSCCRLRNGVDDNVFSYTLGAGGVETGSKNVITLNLNRIVQNWFNEQINRKYVRNRQTLSEYITPIVKRVHKYLNAWNAWLWDNKECGMLPAYDAGFIDLDKQYLTVGVNGFVEAAEFLQSMDEFLPDCFKGIKVDPNNEGYKHLAHEILGTIKTINQEDKDEHHKYNTEFVPAENAAAKLYAWDKKDGYWVPEGRNLYNSYFYVVEDNVNPVSKFYYQGTGFASECDGGVALHCGLDEHLSKEQYRKLMDVAVKAGCNYFTYNIPNTICNECGFISKHKLARCPKCGSENLDYATRIVGYMKRISNFSEARQIEAHSRYYSTIEESANALKNIK